ncbi:hypothetical protein N9U65_01755 [Planctomycetaceae bacterium]|nr:hypothetical protein [Planctomycetaceae bacterium]MDA9718179.1 hypothetical protein [Planctomycetaceae bacterium]
MARNTLNSLAYSHSSKTCQLRHIAKVCLYLVIGAMIGSVPTHVCSQEDVSPHAKTESLNQESSKENTATSQDTGVQPTTQPTTQSTMQSDKNNLNSSSGMTTEKTRPTVEPTPPATVSETTSSLAPTMPETAADGTVSIVIQPNTNAPPPPAELTRPLNPIEPQSPSAVSSQEAIAPPEKTAATLLLERILEPLDLSEANKHLDPTRSGTLYARPLPLIEALQRSGDRSRRLWITQAYWQVSRGYAGIRFATEARERLEFIAPGSDPHDQMVLDVASAAAEADLADAHAQLIAAQQQLVDLVRLPVGEPAPWPVDRPLAGSYETHFAAIFATRPATGRIRAIDRMLPSKHDAVEARAVAVLAAESAMNRAESDHARGKRPIEAVVAAHRMLRLQQEGFAESLATYNLDIAEYAMAVADTSVSDDRYVSMLIGTPIQWKPQPASNVIPATGLQPIEQATTLSNP